MGKRKANGLRPVFCSPPRALHGISKDCCPLEGVQAWPTSFQPRLALVCGCLEGFCDSPGSFGSQQGHVCCGALTLDFDDLAMWRLRVWREDLRAEDVSLKWIPLFICLAVKILGVPAANVLLGGSGALRTQGMGCRSGSPQPPFPRRLLFEPCLSLSVISANG